MSERWRTPPSAEAGRSIGRSTGWTPSSEEDPVPWGEKGSARGALGMPPPGAWAKAMPGVDRRGFGRTKVGDCSRAATAERGDASLGGGREPSDLPGSRSGALGGRAIGLPPKSVLCQRAVSGPMVGGERDERDVGDRMRSPDPMGTGDSERIGDRDVVRHGGM